MTNGLVVAQSVRRDAAHRLLRWAGVAAAATTVLVGCSRAPDAIDSAPPATVTTTVAPITVVSTAPAVTTTLRTTSTVTTGAPPKTVTVRATSPALTPESSSDSLTWWTCERLVRQAAQTSAETGQEPILLKVRTPTVEQDNRRTVKRPSGSRTSIVLACKGSGVWSKGPDNEVTVSLSIDSDGDLMISYRSRSF